MPLTLSPLVASTNLRVPGPLARAPLHQPRSFCRKCYAQGARVARCSPQQFVEYAAALLRSAGKTFDVATWEHQSAA